MTETTLVPAGDLDDRPGFSDQDSPDRYNAERAQREDADVLSVLREVDGAEGVTWKIYRMGADNEEDNGWIADLSTVQLTMQTLSNKFGPGNYRVRGQYTNGTYAGQRTIKIARDAHRAVSVRGDSPVSTSGGGFDMQAFFAMQDKRDEARRQEAKEERDRRRQDRNELLTILAPVMAAAVPALFSRGPDLGSLLTALKPPDPIQTIAALKQLMPDNQQPPASAMDTALKLIDKFRDMAPAEGGTNWMDLGRELIRTLGPVAAPAIEAAMARAQSASSVAVAPTGVAPSVSAITVGPANPSLSAPENASMLGMLALLPWLKEQMAMALTKAASGSNPELIAERIIDDLPAGTQPGTLLQFIEREDWWQKLQQFEPRVATYFPWFQAMRDAMIAVIREGDEGAPRIPAPTMTVTPVESPAEVDRPAGPPKLGL